MQRLEQTLGRIDGRGYKAYKDLQRGRFDFPGFTLLIDHVQGDPYAAPSRMRVQLDWATAGLPESARGNTSRTCAARDFLARAFAAAARRERDVAIDNGGQTVLERSACLFDGDQIELRFFVNLPAAGRRILGRQAATLLCQRLPLIVEQATHSDRLDLGALERHCDVVEDQIALRRTLSDKGLVAFIADGSVLPRSSGVDDRPLDRAVTFESPPSLRVTLKAPNAGEITGMGIPSGICLVVGGGFHGKSTLLRAIATGIYDHIPGDGRELVVADPTAAKIRAEDGRGVSAVDISPFINHLPFDRPTDSFTTELASGSTSQAAALVEAMEAGSRVLLVDEDTSATNFMIRDERMQALVSKEQEPITPFVDRIGELRDRLGISTVLVMGGSGDYFDFADTVIQMESYRPLDVTDAARAIAASHATGRRQERESDLVTPQPRRLDPSSIDPERKPGRVKLQVRGADTLVLGRTTIDLRAVEQIADSSQVRTIGWLLVNLARMPGPLDPVTETERLLQRLADGDWLLPSGRPDGDLALPRLHEVLAALNRMRGVRMAGAG